jgi:hypothetical protein
MMAVVFNGSSLSLTALGVRASPQVRLRVPSHLMHELDRAIGNETHARFVELGRAPRRDELGRPGRRSSGLAVGVLLTLRWATIRAFRGELRRWILPGQH